MVMETIELTDGGILLYNERFLSAELSDRYFVELRDNCVWEQKPGAEKGTDVRFYRLQFI